MKRIDWNLPLETDEPTPRPVTSIQAGGWDGFAARITATFDGKDFVYREDGRPKRGQDGNPPCLRNVRALRTSDECLQRMEALVRRMAGGVAAFTGQDGRPVPLSDEAREIVKLLPAPPVDPDLIEARKLCDAIQQDGANYSDGKHDDLLCVQMTHAGIKRGRELAHAEYTLGPPPGPNDDFLTYRRKLAANGQ